MKPTLVVLAAGMGSRFGGVKQMEGFGPDDQWLLEYSVYDAIQAGFGKVVFILRESILQDFKNHFEERLPKNIGREYVIQDVNNLPEGFTCPAERTKPWGTGQAVLVTKDVVNEPFCVINADDYYGGEAFKQMASFLTTVNQDKFDFCMIGYLLKNTLSENGSVSRGICNVDSNQFLIEVDEHTVIERQPNNEITNTGDGAQSVLDENSIVSMNFWGFTPNMFNQLTSQFKDFLKERGTEMKSEFYIPFAVQDMKDAGLATIEVKTSTDEWFGVTYAADRGQVETELKSKHEQSIYPKNLWK